MSPRPVALVLRALPLLACLGAGCSGAGDGQESCLDFVSSLTGLSSAEAADALGSLQAAAGSVACTVRSSQATTGKSAVVVADVSVVDQDACQACMEARCAAEADVCDGDFACTCNNACVSASLVTGVAWGACSAMSACGSADTRFDAYNRCMAEQCGSPCEQHLAALEEK